MSVLPAAVMTVIGLAVGGCATVPGPVEKYSVKRDVVYSPPGWPEPLKANLYVPDVGRQPSARPAVLLIHGGSWTKPDARWQMSLIARKLARHGYVVLNATYRFAPEWKYPAQLDDLRQAVGWLRDHAAEYGIDSKRIATWGFSAGGQLAALVALRPGGNEPGSAGSGIAAVVLDAAPTDLVFGAGSPALVTYLGGTFEQIPEKYREASPLTYVSRDTPPVFQYQGTRDNRVSVEHTKRFKAALDAAGVRNEVFWVEGRGHGGAFWFDDGAEERAIAFLDSVLP